MNLGCRIRRSCVCGFRANFKCRFPISTSNSLPIDFPSFFALIIFWTIDSWGNRTDQTSHFGNVFRIPCDSQYKKPNDRYDQQRLYVRCRRQHDHDASHSYTYDAENRLIKVDSGTTATCYYDAESRRMRAVAGSSTTDYIRDLSGNVETEENNSCGPNPPCWAFSHIYGN